MSNLFLSDPYRFELETTIAAARPHVAGGVQLALTDLIARGAGGGQPADAAQITLDGAYYLVSEITKAEGRTWFHLPSLTRIPGEGEGATCRIDAERRRRLTRLHSLTHLLMGALRWSLPSYESRGADLNDTATETCLRFVADTFDPYLDVTAVDLFGRWAISVDRPVKAAIVKSVDAAQALYPHWRKDPSLSLSGKIRVIEIGPDIDCNPCSGTHVSSCGEIGPYSIIRTSWRPDLGCFELVAKLEAAWFPWRGEGGAYELPARAGWPPSMRSFRGAGPQGLGDGPAANFPSELPISCKPEETCS